MILGSISGAKIKISVLGAVKTEGQEGHLVPCLTAPRASCLHSDGHNIWESLVSGGKVPSPRTELLHNINPAGGKGYVNPNAALRVGEWKLLVECWNVTTQQATGKVELFHIADDPFEYAAHCR